MKLSSHFFSEVYTGCLLNTTPVKKKQPCWCTNTFTWLIINTLYHIYLCLPLPVIPGKVDLMEYSCNSLSICSPKAYFDYCFAYYAPNLSWNELADNILSPLVHPSDENVHPTSLLILIHLILFSFLVYLWLPSPAMLQDI